MYGHVPQAPSIEVGLYSVQLSRALQNAFQTAIALHAISGKASKIGIFRLCEDIPLHCTVHSWQDCLTRNGGENNFQLALTAFTLH